MTSSSEISSEIQVQEVLNNLTNSIKRDSMEKIELNESLTAVIAQHAAAAQAQTSVQQAQEQANQQQANHEELERIAKEHQQQQQEAQQAHLKQEHEGSQQQQPQEQPNPSTTEESTVIRLDPHNDSTLATVPIRPPSPTPPPAKPVTGSEEWHRQRRDNHKEVERRRRETINAGINDLAAQIPNPDKNKGAILRQAVKYIQGLQEAHQKALAENEALTVIQFEREKALLEKNLVQGQLQTLITEHDTLKRDYESLRKQFDELEEAKKRQRTE